MQIRTKYLKLDKNLLGEQDIFALSQVEDYNGYDEKLKKSTGERAGTKFYVSIRNKEKEIYDEKLEVRIVGDNPIPQYHSGDVAYCKFINLQYILSSVEYGKAEVRATADGIKLVSSNEQQEQTNSNAQVKFKVQQ